MKQKETVSKRTTFLIKIIEEYRKTDNNVIG